MSATITLQLDDALVSTWEQLGGEAWLRQILTHAAIDRHGNPFPETAGGNYQKLLEALPGSWHDLQAVTGMHRSQIWRALTALKMRGLVHVAEVKSIGGRPHNIWARGPAPAGGIVIRGAAGAERRKRSTAVKGVPTNVDPLNLLFKETK